MSSDVDVVGELHDAFAEAEADREIRKSCGDPIMTA